MAGRTPGTRTLPARSGGARLDLLSFYEEIVHLLQRYVQHEHVRLGLEVTVDRLIDIGRRVEPALHGNSLRFVDMVYLHLQAALPC